MSELQESILSSQANRRQRGRSVLIVALCSALAIVAFPSFASVPQKGGVTHSGSTLRVGGTGHDSVVNYSYVPPPKPIAGVPVSSLAGTKEGRAAAALHRATMPHAPVLIATPEPAFAPPTGPTDMSVHVVRTSVKVTSSPGRAPSLISELRRTSSPQSSSRSFLLPTVILAVLGLLFFGWRRYTRSLDAELRGYGIDPNR